MVPVIVYQSQVMMHHPKAPAVMQPGQPCELLADLFILTRLGLIIKYGRMYRKYPTGLPKTDPVLPCSKTCQFPLLSRP